MADLNNNIPNNFINYITAVKPKLSETIIGVIAGLQYSIAFMDIEKAGYFFEKLKKIAGVNEVLKKLFNELEITISDKEWAQSEYKKKLLLSKISVYFESCFENIELDFNNDEQYEKYYFDFVKSRNEIEFGYSYLAFVRYYMSKSNYEQAFNITEIIINKFPDSKFEFLALCDLLDIYKTEFDALERNNEDFSQILEKITQLVFYILKSYSYQDGSFGVISNFSSLVFRNSLESVAMKMFEKISDTFTASVYEEEIKLNFVNYYIGRKKYAEALKYLTEFENVFPKNNKKMAIAIYRFETYIGIEEIVKAYDLYKSIDEKSLENDYDLYCGLYMLFGKFGSLLEKKNSLRESISIYERIYKNSPLKKLKEEALYKLITLNINNYFNNKANIPDEQRNIIKGYCMSFITKFSKSDKTDEVKLIYEGLNVSAKSTLPAAAEKGKNVTSAVNVIEKAPPKKTGELQNELKPEIKVVVDVPVKNAVKDLNKADDRNLKPENPALPGVKIGAAGGLKQDAVRNEQSTGKPANTEPEKIKAAEVKPENKNNLPLKENLLVANSKQKAEYVTKDRLYKTPESLKPENEEVKKTETAGIDPEAGVDNKQDKIQNKMPAPAGGTKFSLFKTILYFVVMAAYYYLFVVMPTNSIAVFYSKMVMSYIPVLLVTGFVIHSFFKKIGLFE